MSSSQSQSGVCQCGHLIDEHATRRVCQVVVHYPSEDYPCHCGGASDMKEESCSECGHRSTEHISKRRCTPLSGELCHCVEIT